MLCVPAVPEHGVFSLVEVTRALREDIIMAAATIKAVKDYFNENLPKSDPRSSVSGFGAEWKQLTDEDKKQIQEGLGNGTLTY